MHGIEVMHYECEWNQMESQSIAALDIHHIDYTTVGIKLRS